MYLDIIYKDPIKVEGISENLLVYDYYIIITVGEFFKALWDNKFISDKEYKRLCDTYRNKLNLYYIKFYESDGILHKRDGEGFWRSLQLGIMGTSERSVKLREEVEGLPGNIEARLRAASDLDELEIVLGEDFFNDKQYINERYEMWQQALDIDDYKTARPNEVDDHFILRLPTWKEFGYDRDHGCRIRIGRIFDGFEDDLKKLLNDKEFTFEKINYDRLFTINWRSRVS
ncbi:MAG: hypothetical protein BAJALOKI1v1_960001 [Promethearchaeota archaeon]|nr:MAG: hypothetical protein BAJALOKI1v1_960001 [Candidatus Lokiarchaeota archaeon]